MNDNIENNDILTIDDVLLDNSYLYYIAAFIVVCGLLLYLLTKKNKKADKENVLICGPNNTGKTVFFYHVS